MNATSSILTPLAFSSSTMLILWAFGGGNLSTFWQRSLILSLGLILLAAVGWGLSQPIIKEIFQKDFWQQKKTKSSLLAGAVFAIPFCVGFVVLKNTNSESTLWLSNYLRSFSSPTWYALPLLALIVAPILELYWRGLIARQWGLFTGAFLEGMIWGFAAQHFSFFAAGFVSAVLIELLIHRNHGLAQAVVAKSMWTLLILITFMVA